MSDNDNDARDDEMTVDDLCGGMVLLLLLRLLVLVSLLLGMMGGAESGGKVDVGGIDEADDLDVMPVELKAEVGETDDARENNICPRRPPNKRPRSVVSAHRSVDEHDDSSTAPPYLSDDHFAGPPKIGRAHV